MASSTDRAGTIDTVDGSFPVDPHVDLSGQHSPQKWVFGNANNGVILEGSFNGTDVHFHVYPTTNGTVTKVDAPNEKQVWLRSMDGSSEAADVTWEVVPAR